ncbi:ABC transporter permease [Opitutus sp. ER46]|uniref:ABC transporter permease n=1 Tax=Opitutus sp. ER46 TaxID=2161864 RepID=UPI000D3182B6|nr:ABC transporter permease [Opitutus sp. ER46]PTX97826.1 hypothetical protein DB354_05990 [Opitutus sp. ER46]
MPTFSHPLIADVRHGVRALRRDRGFTLTALLTFALCLGANVALFAIVNAVLLRPLPFPQPDQLVIVYNCYPKAGVDRAGASVPHFLETRQNIAAFAEVAAYRDTARTIGDAGSPEQIDTMSITPAFFSVLGVKPALGRAFSEKEGTEGNSNVVILSDGLWRERFAADPGVIGRTLRLDGGTLCTVVGVMPRGFEYLSRHTQLWTPIVFSEAERKPDRRHSNNMAMIARLKPDASIAVAQAQLDAHHRAALAQDPYAKLVTDAGFHVQVLSLHEDHIANTRTMVLLLQAGVFLLLVIGVVNLTNLLLVRATARMKELSVRQVLGATGLQLTRQIVAETVVLALAGGVLGLGIGWVALRAFNALGLDQLPRSGDFGLDPLVCVVALGTALLLGLLLAAPVLWHTRHHNLATALSVESRGGTTSRATHRLRHALIVAQFALAFVLLVNAGLLGISFARVSAVNPGFQPENVLTARVSLPRIRYADAAQRNAFFERLGQELGNLPGVSAVGFSSMLPFSNDSDSNAVTVEGYTPAPGDSIRSHYMGGVTGDYFAALGIPLREGRLLSREDSTRKSRVCVIDEDVARRYWPKGGALGGRIWNGVPEAKDEPYVVVGVVGAIKQNDLADPRTPGAIYLPYSLYASREVSLALRTAMAAESLAPALRATVLRLDGDLPLANLKSMSTRIDDSLQQRRSPLLLAVLFAGLALLLVTVGLYGVLAYSVSQRRREIGVRMALGARPADIRGQFLALGAKLVLGGAALGGLGAWWSGRTMDSLLFGVRPDQPLVFAATMVVLTVVALLACFIPALRAARVPPMEALRSE